MPTPSLTPDTSLNWWNSWLTEPVCKPPCWQNITPGTTTVKEAISIFENSPDIKIRSRSSDGVDWDFNQNQFESGTLTASQDGVVRTIRIASDSDRKFLLQTIIATYGNPKYVKPDDCRSGTCVMTLIYPGLGMLLSVFVENSSGNDEIPHIEILPETIITDIYFIESGMENFQKLTDFQNYDLLMDWKGYGEYP